MRSGSVIPVNPSLHTAVRVREFHEAFGHPVAQAPTPGDAALRELRVKLIAEELAELCSALGVSLLLEVNPQTEEGELVVEAVLGDDQVDLVEAADALGDLDYVVQGTNVALGFPAEEIVAEIHRSNMSKLGADGKPIYREDGKVLKGPNYRPPNLAPLVDGGRYPRTCAKCGRSEDAHPYRHPFVSIGRSR